MAKDQTQGGLGLPPMDADGISARLGEAAREVRVEVYPTLDSTSSEAKRRARAGELGPLLIVAESQSNGRGRLGRSFYSPAGAGIYMTYLWRPQAAAVDAVSVTTAASVAVLRAMSSMEALAGHELAIKWVNDIYLSGKKVCGILTEAVTDAADGSVSCMLVGIGINVAPTAFPPELAEIATSLCVKDLDRNELIARILRELLACLHSRDPYAHMAYYRAHSLVIGRTVNTICAGISTPGVVLDIAADGGLVVRREDGSVEVIRSGEVSLRFSREKGTESLIQ